MYQGGIYDLIGVTYVHTKAGTDGLPVNYVHHQVLCKYQWRQGRKKGYLFQPSSWIQCSGEHFANDIIIYHITCVLCNKN